MRRALVTGASGFVGPWLCRALLREGWDVTGVSLTTLPANSILSASERAAVRWIQTDLLAGSTIAQVVGESTPDAVFHLAGISFVPAFGDDPLAGFRTNVETTVSILAAVKQLRGASTLDPVVLVIGSSEQYGRHSPLDGPLSEHAVCRPATWYAASKTAQEAMALGAFRAEGLRVVATRSFNQAGPGQSPRFLLPSLVERVRALKAHVAHDAKLILGNLDTTRDFVHVADATEAYVALVDRGIPGEVYNVCSGEGVTVEALAREVCARAGVDADLVSDPALRRAVDVPWLVGDNAKLRSTTGWVPHRSRSDIIDDLLNAASH